MFDIRSLETGVTPDIWSILLTIANAIEQLPAMVQANEKGFSGAIKVALSLGGLTAQSINRLCQALPIDSELYPYLADKLRNTITMRDLNVYATDIRDMPVEAIYKILAETVDLPFEEDVDLDIQNETALIRFLTFLLKLPQVET
jgi:hypothetical protein